jgi:hypothetical protein
MRAAFFGGIYNNHLALAAAIADARGRGVDALYCLGDVGGFGPHPDRALELLRASGIPTVQGNYDHSIGHALADCGCGYTDPRDNHFARLSYAYTQQKTSSEHRPWLAGLPERIGVDGGGRRVVLVHGSPGQHNFFVW